MSAPPRYRPSACLSAPPRGRAAGPVQGWLSRNGHRVFHPLCGADLATLALLTASGFRPTPLGAARFAAAWATAALRSPFDLAEAARAAAFAPAPSEGPPPVFVVGFWRSGTTHVANALAANPALGFVPPLAAALPWNFEAAYGWGFARRRLEECLPEHRVIDAVPVFPDSPQEDELALASMQGLSLHRALYFPKSARGGFRAELRRDLLFEGAAVPEVERWRSRCSLLLAKLRRRAGARPLVVKNPAHTGRLPELLDLFPNARVLHVRRDPWKVAASARRMLRSLLDAFALEDPRAVSDAEIEATVLEIYPEAMRRLDAVWGALPEHRRYELAFEDFERDPLGELARLHQSLNLPGWPEARAPCAAYLRRSRFHEPRRHAFEPSSAARLSRAMAPWIERWGYRPPPAPRELEPAVALEAALR